MSVSETVMGTVSATTHAKITKGRGSRTAAPLPCLCCCPLCPVLSCVEDPLLCCSLTEGLPRVPADAEACAEASCDRTTGRLPPPPPPCELCAELGAELCEELCEELDLLCVEEVGLDECEAVALRTLATTRDDAFAAPVAAVVAFERTAHVVAKSEQQSPWAMQ